MENVVKSWSEFQYKINNAFHFDRFLLAEARISHLVSLSSWLDLASLSLKFMQKMHSCDEMLWKYTAC